MVGISTVLINLTKPPTVPRATGGFGSHQAAGFVKKSGWGFFFWLHNWQKILGLESLGQPKPAKGRCKSGLRKDYKHGNIGLKGANCRVGLEGPGGAGRTM